MAMFGYFKDGFVMEQEKPKQPAAKAVAKKTGTKTGGRQPSSLRPARTGLWQNLFGRGKK